MDGTASALELVAEAVRRAPSRPALALPGGREVGYGELWAASEAAARRLRRRAAGSLGGRLGAVVLGAAAPAEPPLAQVGLSLAVGLAGGW